MGNFVYNITTESDEIEKKNKPNVSSRWRNNHLHDSRSI